MSKVAIVQSNYLPWKGYFDLIASVDEFIVYDDVQYTRSDWRNRNRIKTPQGLQWLTVPVRKASHFRPIREAEIDGSHWARKHWRALEANYGRAPCYGEVAETLEPVLVGTHHTHLSRLNRALIDWACDQLGITTRIRDVSEYRRGEGRSERLVDLCEQAGAREYVSGPSARAYLDTSAFAAAGIDVTWFDYTGYPEYPQLWGEFVHEVSIVDLLFCCGADAPRYMKYVA